MDRTRRQLLGGIGGAAAAVALRRVTALAQNAPSPFGATFGTSDQRITDQVLWSPIEVTAPGVVFERCIFKSTDPQHTLLTTGERTQVHNCDFLGNYTYGGRRGIAVNSPGGIITKSRFRDLHHAQDAQCIAGWDDTRDLLVEDCFGEASGENVIFGGADALSQDRQPQNIIIRRCTWTKPTYWSSKPSGATVKNCLELKNAKNVLIEDCNFAQSWLDGQTGFCLVLTVRNQDGTNPWASIEDITIRKCVTRDTIGVFQILGVDDTNPSGVMRRVRVEHCRFEYRDGTAIQIGNGVEGFDVQDCSFWSANNGKFLGFNNPQRPNVGLTISDSDANEGGYGIHGDDTAPGQPTLDVYAPDATFSNVTLWRTAWTNNYPYPAGITVG